MGQPNRSNSFVLRIWWEGERARSWRGWVQHATSGEVRYFSRLDDLLAFIEKYSGIAAQADGEIKKERETTNEA